MTPLEETKLPLNTFVGLERNGPVPIYYQLSQRLEKAIYDGALPAGSRLENELALTERLGLSRPTIRRAIQELVNKGLLVRRRGIGTQVVHGRVERNIELTSLYDDLTRSGRHPKTLVLASARDKASVETAEYLGIQPKSNVLHICRLRTADEVPVAILDNVLPERFLDLSIDDLSKFGLYQMLNTRGVTIQVAQQRIGARVATDFEAEQLELSKGSPVLTMMRTAFDNSGRAIEHGRHVYRPEMYSFEMTLVER